MNAQKKLRSVPVAPVEEVRRPIGRPKTKKPARDDVLTGTEPTQAVSRSLRWAIRDHSYTSPRSSADAPSRLGLALWTLLLASLLALGYMTTTKRETVEVKTYQLQR